MVVPSVFCLDRGSRGDATRQQPPLSNDFTHNRSFSGILELRIPKAVGLEIWITHAMATSTDSSGARGMCDSVLKLPPQLRVSRNNRRNQIPNPKAT